ncbi:N-acetyltransferase [Massilia sp. UBA6681]|uniref:N-acetyltransferase n=1 Tax=Massilia sp. UBA6681 TaxID=1946839 RepID=UPI0025B7E819|nr:N-acetyltransferase [Massilia sp. UBA6681]
MASILAPGFGWAWQRPAELRIDVVHRPDDLGRELDELYRRMQRPGHRLHGMATVPVAPGEYPALVFRHREADGEHYVYAEDLQLRRLAGYTVFNRLVELDRRADRHLRAPHSKFAPPYQRKGIATAIYRWWLQGGNCLISGARQSAGAHALWLSLARRRELLYVTLRDKKLRQQAPGAAPCLGDDFHTRMILLGDGWSAERLASSTGMLPCDPQAPAPA